MRIIAWLAVSVIAISFLAVSFQDVTAQFGPSFPTITRAEAGDQTIILTWDPPANDAESPVVSYKVTLRLQNDADPRKTTIVYSTSLSSNTFSYTFDNLINGRNYHVAVTAINSEGSFSETFRQNIMPTGPPDAPRNLSVTSGDSSVTLKWEEPHHDGGPKITEYIVLARIGSVNTFASIETVSGDARQVTLSNLMDGIQYQFAIVAQNSVGQSLPSNTVYATLLSTPSSPTNFMVKQSPPHATLTWDKPSNDGGLPITKYIVTIQLPTIQSAVPTQTFDVPATSTTFVTHQHNLELFALSEYTFSVQAVNSLGPGTPSESITIVAGR